MYPVEILDPGRGSEEGVLLRIKKLAETNLLISLVKSYAIHQGRSAKIVSQFNDINFVKITIDVRFSKEKTSPKSDVVIGEF